MLRGLFDADGCISKYTGKYNIYPQFNIVGTKHCLKAVKRILNLNSKIGKKENIFQLSKSGSDVKNIYKQLYKNSAICLGRKYNKFQEFYNKRRI
jgi:hypothetical protein